MFQDIRLSRDVIDAIKEVLPHRPDCIYSSFEMTGAAIRYQLDKYEFEQGAFHEISEFLHNENIRIDIDATQLFPVTAHYILKPRLRNMFEDIARCMTFFHLPKDTPLDEVRQYLENQFRSCSN